MIYYNIGSGYIIMVYFNIVSGYSSLSFIITSVDDYYDLL